jgi:hypothetical protein
MLILQMAQSFNVFSAQSAEFAAPGMIRRLGDFVHSRDVVERRGELSVRRTDEVTEGAEAEKHVLDFRKRCCFSSRGSPPQSPVLSGVNDERLIAQASIPREPY